MFGSGCAALVYEVVWFQMLALLIGSTTVSLGILLAAYMGGMCLGSVLSPRIARRYTHPLRLYAHVELGTALFALLTLVEVPLFTSLYATTAPHGLFAIILRAVIAGICLIPPAMFLGATLPIATLWLNVDPRHSAKIGALYSSNIAGAIFGCLLAGFYLLRLYDTVTTTLAAVVINLAVASGAFALSALPFQRREEVGSRRVALSAFPRTLSTALVVSGFCALGAEVVWTRLLSLLLGATVYTFSIILATFLGGLAVGSAAASALVRLGSHPRVAFGVCLLFLALSIAWAAVAIQTSLPYWPISSGLATNPWIGFQLDAARCLWAVLPAALLWGAAFPLAVAAASRPGMAYDDVVAGAYVLNTCGNILGALVCTFWLVPAVGSQSTQKVLAFASLGAGLVLLLPALGSGRGSKRGRSLLALTGVVIGIFLVCARIPPVPPGLIAFGRSLAYRLGAFNPATNRPVGLPAIQFAGEGINESVAVSDFGGTRLFSVSGKIEASTARKDMRLQHMLGDIPALFHPAPTSVLIVGFGAGVTAGSFVPYPTIKRIVICELEPLIPRVVSGYFSEANNEVANDPRVQIVYDDARHFMLTTREKFDVITSDPIHPWVKGSAALYSREYFDLVKRRLNPGGFVTQWVPLYQSSAETIRGELRTFFQAFPNGSVWANNVEGSGYDLVLLGGIGPQQLNLDSLNVRLQSGGYGRITQELGALGFNSIPDFLSTYAGRASDMTDWLKGATINRDRNLWLQYHAGLETFVEDESEIYRQIASYRHFPDSMFLGSQALRQQVRDRFSGPPPGP